MIMPYIHPVYGVPCTAVSGFFAHEAKMAGKEIGEIMEGFYQDVADDREHGRKEFIKNRDNALRKLVEFYAADKERNFFPVSVLEVTRAHILTGYRMSKMTFAARVKCDDGKERILEYSEASQSGSIYEMKDFQCECREID